MIHVKSLSISPSHSNVSDFKNEKKKQFSTHGMSPLITDNTFDNLESISLSKWQKISHYAIFLAL